MSEQVVIQGGVDRDLRPGEVVAELPLAAEVRLFFIGLIRTPWRERRECPRHGDPVDGPLCRVEVVPAWRPALQGVEEGGAAQILYWMHRARRDLAIQAPRAGARMGTFALRSPVRPNPIASSIVRIEQLRDDGLVVRGLDCLDGTPLLDVKPESCPNWEG